jgi:hypothetical protein
MALNIEALNNELRMAAALLGLTFVKGIPNVAKLLVSSVPESKVSTGREEPFLTKANSEANAACADADPKAMWKSASWPVRNIFPALAGEPVAEANAATAAATATLRRLNGDRFDFMIVSPLKTNRTAGYRPLMLMRARRARI